MIRYRRHGALHFFRIGRLQLSWCWCAPHGKSRAYRRRLARRVREPEDWAVRDYRETRT
jgi:hypothetical protein